jgi:REP element-mobilizing transposase RayT
LVIVFKGKSNLKGGTRSGGRSIEAMEVAEDHVHIFLGFPPRHSISQVVQRFKGQSARKIFQVFPDVKKELWGANFGKMVTLLVQWGTK